MHLDFERPLSRPEARRSEKEWSELHRLVAAYGHSGHNFMGLGVGDDSGHFMITTYECCGEVLFVKRQCRRIDEQGSCDECEPLWIRWLRRVFPNPLTRLQ